MASCLCAFIIIFFSLAPFFALAALARLLNMLFLAQCYKHEERTEKRQRNANYQLFIDGQR